MKTGKILIVLLPFVFFANPGLSQPVTLVAVGDSLTAGDGDDGSGGGYPARVLGMLQDGHPGSTLSNRAISGDTTQDLINKQLHDAVADLNGAPAGNLKIAIVWIGSNDFFGLYASDVCTEYYDSLSACERAETENSANNADAILAQLKATGAEVYVALLDDQSKRPVIADASLRNDVFPGFADDEIPRMSARIAIYNDRLETIAAARGAETVDFFNTTIFENAATLSDDGNHPNGAGYDAISRIWHRAIAGSSGPTSASLYFPHVASNGTWETEICVLNTHSSETLTGTLKPYDDDGNPVSIDMPVSLPPFGRRQIEVGDEFADAGDIGYMVLEISQGEASGYVKFWIQGKYRVAVPAVSEINAGDIYVSHIASNALWGTGISLVNTTYASKTITFEFNEGTTVVETLAPRQHRAFTIRGLFGGAPPPGLESAVIKDASGVVGLELFGSTPEGGNYLSGVLLRDDTADRIYYPHVASDAAWWTGIVSYNPGSEACRMTIQPYAADGTALATQYADIGARRKYIGGAADLGLPEGTAWFSVSSTKPITGFELFGTLDGNMLAGYTGVGISGKSGVFPKKEDETEGGTGIAFVNIEDEVAKVTLVAADDDGAWVADEEILLAPYEKRVSLAENFFSESIREATCVWYSSDREIVGFQLNAARDGMMLDGLPGQKTSHGAPKAPDEPSPPPPPNGNDLVQASDFTYLGAFRLPGGDTPPETFAYGGNAMSFNPDGDAGNADAWARAGTPTEGRVRRRTTIIAARSRPETARPVEAGGATGFRPSFCCTIPTTSPVWPKGT